MDCTANNAILEGLACGTPVVASDVGAVRDYLTEECAVLTEKGDPVAMAESLLALLADHDRRQEMAVNARQQALAFDWAVVADRLQVIYEKLFD
jgi:glycosyltransferase involved in cell wall biosynthesis